MWDDITRTVWALLPEITVGLRFCSALIGLGLAADSLGRRLRRRHGKDDLSRQ